MPNGSLNVLQCLVYKSFITDTKEKYNIVYRFYAVQLIIAEFDQGIWKNQDIYKYIYYNSFYWAIWYSNPTIIRFRHIWTVCNIKTEIDEDIFET